MKDLLIKKITAIKFKIHTLLMKSSAYPSPFYIQLPNFYKKILTC